MKNKKSLYREYRPKNFDQVAGHEGIKEILISQIESGNFPHALLFSGQRGTGKTSIAKILSKIMNCENLKKYNPCENCISCKEFNNNSHADIFEIDAASNNGIEEIRNIKANISMLPTFAKYKVFIIDEIHMLSNSAFNALLKTLEEPPKYVIFILATTEFSKIPETIISRCQLFNFKKISQKSLEEKINEISNKEGKEITEDALNEIYYMSDGSLRDALNFLEQSLIVSNEKVTVDDLKKIFYISTKNEKLSIIKNVLDGNSEEIINYFEKSNEQGIDFQMMSLSLLDILKEIIEVKLTSNQKFLNNLNMEEFNKFKKYDVSIFFDLSDNIAESYTKSKNSNISFQYILINILKTLNNKTLISLQENKKINFSNSDNFLIKEHKNEEKIDQNKILEVLENNLIKDSLSLSNKNEENSFLKIQIKLLLEETKGNNWNIDFSNEQIINILANANKEIRTKLENTITNLFLNEDILMNKDKCKALIMFYNSKITAASENGIIFVCEERTISNWINIRLQNKIIREEIWNFLGSKFAIISITKKRWQEIKFEFLNRKNNNQLNKEKIVDIESFYDSFFINKEQNDEDNDYLKRAMEIFGINNIKVVN
ncbi:DNA polymerase III subunit gamma/tau [Spiroplasma taiwanense]|uniref:DNA polymerase III subunit gamma/tau n=1 Tax=Spiroplasma taiwanense CT-1 TaxID=1276220 RepID=S5LSS2_9MOLU|nr:DNA polymerase III subunit gamma/tau [Spiroplasma taiwanense]AGR40704.1 DNA polymerase III subunits gamma and tau [Spiroplasma taiwanense CT-1]